MTMQRMALRRLTQLATTGMIVAAGLAGAVAKGPAASAGPVPGTTAAKALMWRVQSPPHPAGRTGPDLDGVSCSSSSACLAIGDDVVPSSPKTIILGALAETWNGSHWRLRTVPNGNGRAYLNGVKCRSARFCVAVGSVLSDPSTGAQAAIADSWNGRAFRQVRLAVPVGTTYSELTAVACSGTDACMAVGSFTNKSNPSGLLAERWNGSSWKIQRVPAPPGGGGSLNAVACPKVNACRAVGYDSRGVLAEFWNGSAWTAQQLPTPPDGGSPSLHGISCTAADSCEAVGNYEQSSNISFVALAEVWNGKLWKVQATPRVPRATTAGLQAISCVSATDCEAGGQILTNGDSIGHGLLEKWNGRKWAVQRTDSPGPGKTSNVWSISCTAGPVCEATGFVPLALRYSR